MSRKVYVAIAAILQDIDTNSTAQLSVEMYKSTLVSKLCYYFQNEKVNFKPAKFRAACYRKDE